MSSDGETVNVTQTILVVVILSGIVLLMSWTGIGRLRHWAARRYLLDFPNHRSSHSRPTPRGGGLVITTLTLLGGSLLYFVWGASFSVQAFSAFLVGALIVAIVSWLDDLKPVSSRLRLVVHIIAALIAIAGVGYIHSVQIPLLGAIDLGWIGVLITLVWIVGLTNAYNFMDGIDGLAGSQAVIGGLGWMVFGEIFAEPFVFALGLLIASSSMGFLVYNWPPARIFMGDVGSAFLGFTFAVLPLLVIQGTPNTANALGIPVAAVALVWCFVFDSGFTFLRRLFQGENVFEAHRSHLYQRLVISGYSHLKVTLIYIGFGLLSAAIAVSYTLGMPFTGYAILLGLPAIGAMLWLLVRRQERAKQSSI
jgi:UDP-N-acetylmuramyl pentapeptide phosphotransferase/UDP-N-acetylglucosamine-1-phosphate transferase